MKNNQRIYQSKHKFFEYLATQLSPHKKIELNRNIKLKDGIIDYD